jgi:acetoin utilization protein AcuB
MTTSPTTVSPEMPVLEARELMAKGRFRHLLVVEEGSLQGVITDRDIRLNLPSQASSLSVWELNYLLARLTVGTVMTKAVVMVETGARGGGSGPI